MYLDEIAKGEPPHLSSAIASGYVFRLGYYIGLRAGLNHGRRNMKPKNSVFDYSEFVTLMLCMSADELAELEQRMLRLDIDGSTVREIIAAAKYIKEYKASA
jgi:hypothetical protein